MYQSIPQEYKTYWIEGIPVYAEDQLEDDDLWFDETLEAAPPVFALAVLRYCHGEEPPVWSLEFETEEHGLLSVTLTPKILDRILELECQYQDELVAQDFAEHAKACEACANA